MFIILPTIYYVHRFHSLSFFQPRPLTAHVQGFYFVLSCDNNTFTRHGKDTLQKFVANYRLNHTTEYLKHKT